MGGSPTPCLRSLTSFHMATATASKLLEPSGFFVRDAKATVGAVASEIASLCDLCFWRSPLWGWFQGRPGKLTFMLGIYPFQTPKSWGSGTAIHDFEFVARGKLFQVGGSRFPCTPTREATIWQDSVSRKFELAASNSVCLVRNTCRKRGFNPFLFLSSQPKEIPE